LLYACVPVRHAACGPPRRALTSHSMAATIHALNLEPPRLPALRPPRYFAFRPFSHGMSVGSPCRVRYTLTSTKCNSNSLSTTKVQRRRNFRLWTPLRLCVLSVARCALNSRKSKKHNSARAWRGHDGASPASAGAHRGGFGHGQRCCACPRRQHRRELTTGMITPLWELQHPPLLPQQKAVDYNTIRGSSNSTEL